jgi:hypothetical protein
LQHRDRPLNAQQGLVTLCLLQAQRVQALLAFSYSAWRPARRRSMVSFI